MPIALGIGAVILLAVALSKGRHRGPNADTAPRVTPPIPEEESAANAVRNGEGTAEDFETLADSAERQGDNQTAERLRERATSAPERSTVEQAHATPPPAPAPAPHAPPTPTPAPHAPPAPTPPAPAPHAPPTPPAAHLPAGFNPTEAARLASAVALNIRTRRYSYSRRGLTAFQRAAGLAPDGLYGGKSAGALRFYGATPPRPLFKSHGSIAVIPYPSNLANAARSARA